MQRSHAARFGLCLSLLLAVGLAFGGQYAELARRLERVRPADRMRFVNDAELTNAEENPIATRAAKFAKTRKEEDWQSLLRTAKLYARAESASAGEPANDLARKIKADPIYRENAKRSSNWIARAAEKIGALFANRPRQRPDPSEPDLPAVNLSWVTPVMWGLLIIGAVVGVVWALRQFSWKFSRGKKIKAILEEDEPERSADEWLAHADGLAAQGKFREAVRSLYLACLVRLDEARLCRFIRSDTNWEHFSRLMANPDRPENLDFLEPTQRFDRIYYGYRINGMMDVDYFREVYRTVCDHILIRSAR